MAPKLEVELVPASCWFSNVRSQVSAKDWETCKRIVRTRSGSRCEICGGRGSRWAVECHEIWSYDDDQMIQTLVGLIALCPACHEVKHIGLAERRGHQKRALMHLARVNGWSESYALHYVRMAFDLWRLRSDEKWDLDISYLSLIGIDTDAILRANARSI